MTSCPFTAPELRHLYAERLFSCEEIARLATARWGAPVSKVKVWVWLQAAGIPVRTFSEAARARASKSERIR